MTTIDFTKALQDAKGASFEALPVGDYDIEVAKSEAVTSSNGKPMIKVTMRVITGPYEKRPISSQFVMSVENPQAVAIFFRHMKAFGLTEEWFAALGQVPNLEPVANALMGRRARLTVGHREWQGETRNEVKSVKPYTGAPPVGPGAVAAPGGPTAPRPVGAPLPPPPPAAPALPPAPPVATAPVAPSAPPAAPQVQAMPQPPAPPVAPPVPTPAPAAGAEVGTSNGYAPTVATSDAPVPPAPPTLPV